MGGGRVGYGRLGIVLARFSWCSYGDGSHGGRGIAQSAVIQLDLPRLPAGRPVAALGLSQGYGPSMPARWRITSVLICEHPVSRCRPNAMATPVEASGIGAKRSLLDMVDGGANQENRTPSKGSTWTAPALAAAAAAASSSVTDSPSGLKRVRTSM